MTFKMVLVSILILTLPQWLILDAKPGIVQCVLNAQTDGYLIKLVLAFLSMIYAVNMTTKDSVSLVILDTLCFKEVANMLKKNSLILDVLNGISKHILALPVLISGFST